MRAMLSGELEQRDRRAGWRALLVLGSLRLASAGGVALLILAFALWPPGMADLFLGLFACALGFLPAMLEIVAGDVRDTEDRRSERVKLLRADTRALEAGTLSEPESESGRLSFRGG